MNREKVMTFMKKSLRFLPDKAYIKLYYTHVFTEREFLCVSDSGER